MTEIVMKVKATVIL